MLYGVYYESRKIWLHYTNYYLFCEWFVIKITKEMRLSQFANVGF